MTARSSGRALVGAIQGGLASLKVRNALLFAMMTLAAVVVVQGYMGITKVGNAHDATESLYQQRLEAGGHAGRHRRARASCAPASDGLCSTPRESGQQAP